MDPQIGLMGFRIAVYVVLVSGGMLLFLKPGTAEFVISALSLGIGLLFGGIIGIWAYVSGRRAIRHGIPPIGDDHDQPLG
ncbi:MAG: hypothetical protein Kow0047_04420 [Anaerolineae bacterium]